MNPAQIRKLSVVINTAIFLLVIGLGAFFYMCKAEFLVWFSIPTLLVYVLGYILIAKERYQFYVRLVYAWITVYMSLATVCLGYKFGFHLYCLSMIPINYYTEYMSFKLGKKNVNTNLITVLVVICYLFATGYSGVVGPIYETDPMFASIFWIINSSTVILFLIIYSSLMMKGIITSEKKLFDMAHKDRLTGLYNRHYMMGILEEAEKDEKDYCLAMLDIDFFKKVNDVYGHNAGDEVLRKVADSMTEVCKDCVISRWGGEEFLILVNGKISDGGLDLLEKLRTKVEATHILFEDKDIKVTLTTGISDKDKDISLDKWIMSADEKLYEGKHSGKNRVVT